MKLEERLGFRSSFNFVPLRYAVSPSLRKSLVDRGFEVGVHGLYHDGKYYLTRNTFVERAKKINHYLKEWNSVGYRAPAMFNKLEWFHDLNIEYDASTFDTDPFEPNAKGVGTVFPYFVKCEKTEKTFVELPYTLVQDFTLFVLMRKDNINIRKRKLDWVAKHGGVALMNTHPDYMKFDGGLCGNEQYPAERYSEFLEYVSDRYKGEYWDVLPRDIARFWIQRSKPVSDGLDSPDKNTRINSQRISRELPIGIRKRLSSRLSRSNKIWIDMDNSPHVPFFRPIISELRAHGYDVTLTARDCSQTCGLGDLYGMNYKRIGKHFGKNKIFKVFGLLVRVVQLIPFALKERPSLALSHGSRAQWLLAYLLRIPLFLIGDYEHAQMLVSPTWMMVPEVIDIDRFHRKGQVLQFSGIKEDVYVPEFKPDAAICRELGIDDSEIVVTVRPPATTAHYHNPESEVLFHATMEHLSRISSHKSIYTAAR